jgi:2-isopropylmalate synthase
MLFVSLYDSTLRDGAQMAGVQFSRQDKFLIVKNLVDELAIPYIELYPFSNPKDRKLIEDITEKAPQYIPHLVAFGSTRRTGVKPEEDDNLKALIESGLKFVTIFGKAWDFHLEFIHATPEQNLEMIEDSVRYLKDNGKTVFYDAEHFFDGYKANPEYAISTLLAAERGGADLIVLCDTNGGTMPHEVYDITEFVLERIKIPLGIHAHNDCGMGVGNSIAAVQACINHNRACQIQGTMNGLGERTGNANLTIILPILALKMKLKGIIPSQKLKNLTSVSNLIHEICNFVPPLNTPFVGYNAFSHKGGMHIAAINKDFKSYEHVDPNAIGNKRRMLISEMSGRSALLHKSKKLGIEFKKDDPILIDILRVIKRKESHGYTYEGAEASLVILIRGMMKDIKQESAYFRRYYFEVDYFRVITDARNLFDEENLEIFTDANLKTIVSNDHEDHDDHEYHTAAEGNGPINALDKALKKALIHFYPVLREIELIDFKVRIANAAEEEYGTASRVRVLVETRDKDGQIYGTIGAHVNIIVASFVALLDAYVFKLMKNEEQPYHKE